MVYLPRIRCLPWPPTTYQRYDVDYPYGRSLTSVGRVLLFFLHGNWGDEVCSELCLGQLFPNNFFFGKTCGSPIGANFNRLPVQLATCQPPELAFGQGYLDPVSPD